MCRSFIGNDINNERFVLSKVKGSCASIPTIESFPAYSAPIPINPLKISDVRKLQQYIPAEYKNFYDNILQWPTAEAPPTKDVEKDF